MPGTGGIPGALPELPLAGPHGQGIAAGSQGWGPGKLRQEGKAAH